MSGRSLLAPDLKLALKRTVDLAQRLLSSSYQVLGMDEPEPEKRPTPKPTRLEEVRRIIEEYADDLREIIRKLRQRMN